MCVSKNKYFLVLLTLVISKNEYFSLNIIIFVVEYFKYNEDCLVPVCLPGNGQCSPGDENPRMLADASAANGQTVPQGLNSPSGEL